MFLSLAFERLSNKGLLSQHINNY